MSILLVLAAVVGENRGVLGWSPPVGEVSPKVTEGLTDRRLLP